MFLVYLQPLLHQVTVSLEKMFERRKEALGFKILTQPSNRNVSLTKI